MLCHAGSSTACIVCLNGAKVHAANIGDSGFMIVRDGKLVFESPAQQHSFNFPFQIGSRGDPVGSSQVCGLAALPDHIRRCALLDALRFLPSEHDRVPYTHAVCCNAAHSCLMSVTCGFDCATC